MSRMHYSAKPIHKIIVEMSEGKTLILDNVREVNLAHTNDIDYYPAIMGSEAIARRSDFVRWEMTATGYAKNTLWSPSKDIVTATTKDITELEWRCQYCKSVNPAARVNCMSCAGQRTFLYDIMDHAAREWPKS